MGLLPLISFAEEITVFYDFSKPKLEFAAKDIRTALVAKGFTVKFMQLSAFNEKFSRKKIVIALQSNAQVKSLFQKQGGSNIQKLDEQAFALRPTPGPAISYWVIGGDETGAMYGALQVAENINFNGFAKMDNSEFSPFVKKRGIKFNIPLDRRAPTYENDNGGTSHKLAIQHVRDITFWKDYLDEMARNRFTSLSLWNPTPFTFVIDR